VAAAIEETQLAAVWAMGARKATKLELYLQPVKETNPDVRVSCDVKSNSESFPFNGGIMEIEVTRYEEHANGNLSEFIINGKFKKQYADETIILIALNKPGETSEGWKEISEKLAGCKVPYNVFLLGRMDGKYIIGRVYPKLDFLVPFNIKEEGSKEYTNPQGIKVVNLHYPSRTFSKHVPEGFNPFIDDV
jgi:hypothetical protein